MKKVVGILGLVMLCVVIAFASTKALKRIAPSMAVTAIEPVVPFGISTFGEPVTVSITNPDDLSLEIRKNCNWGNPGRNAYKGTVEQALAAAKLPKEVQDDLIAKINVGKAIDRLEITNEKIAAIHSDLVFSPKGIHMTFGRTLCIDSNVNFKPGHIERADLYESVDNRGIIHSVMVPYVCGNISVLGARAEQPDDTVQVAGVSTTAQTPAINGVPLTRSNIPSSVVVGKGQVVTTPSPPPILLVQPALIPEPNTLLLFAIGAILLLL